VCQDEAGEVDRKWALVSEKRRIRPPQRFDTEEDRKPEELADVPVGVLAPEELTGEESGPERRGWEVSMVELFIMLVVRGGSTHGLSPGHR
jgi:hypothetical protein